MPSALTGNTSGLATAVSPGLVGITTQTFAGDKTLTGLTTASGGLLNTGLTGANATTVTTSGSGKVGEIISASLSDVSLTSTVAANAGTLTLQPGIYTVFFKGTVDAAAFSTYTSTFCSISTTSASHDVTNRVLEFSTFTSAEHSPGTCVKTINVTTASFPVYGVITGTFSATTPVSKGSKSQLYATRIA